ncbi:MAG: DUF4184 family protein [Acidimicrobiales bacterium]
MPFTIAHAIVAPPLAKLTGGRLAVSALAVGAMAPDFEYLLFLETRRTVGHTPLGLLTFCLPASLCVLLLWHGLVKRPLAGLLPDRWAHVGAALSRPLPRSWQLVAATVAGVLLGAWTHIAWDSFTHVDGGMVQALPVLRRSVLGRANYLNLQYGGGVVGMALLGVGIFVWARRQPPVAVAQPPARRRIACAVAIVGFTLVAALANVARATLRYGLPNPKGLLVAAVLGMMAGAAVAVTAYGVTETARRPA